MAHALCGEANLCCALFEMEWKSALLDQYSNTNYGKKKNRAQKFDKLQFTSFWFVHRPWDWNEYCCTWTEWPSGQLHNANRMRKGHTITLCLHIRQDQTNRKNLVKDIRLCQTILNLWALAVGVCLCVFAEKCFEIRHCHLPCVGEMPHLQFRRNLQATATQSNRIFYSHFALHQTKSN